ncbi:MAG: sugar ABC transporter permease, partial [Lachnospiraceae bacterium]|nr:sugar ABC transporter permease [Lachnospiraceae bacterium]
MSKENVMEFVKKYTMIIVLILVTAFFAWKTGGKILLPQNINNLIAQNAYVFVLATGMLLCILTGGNIDLSVGSVVCFVGAVGATLMENKGVNVWVSILIMLLVGLAIGAWQGFWIAFVHVPPFITTLAGMLVFRGLSNVVLNGMTISIKNEVFVNLFGGGAECYIPDLFGMEGFNMTCMIAGIVAVAIFVIIQLKGYFSKKSKGYETGSFASLIAKTVVLSVVIL